MPSATDLSAAKTAKNTGLAGVPERLKRMRAVMFVPKGDIIPTASLGTPYTTLKAKALADNAASRMYVIGPIGEVTAQNTETKRLQWAYGYELSVEYGVTIMTMHPFTTDQRVTDQMQAFNGSQENYDVFLFDESYNLIGTADSTGVKAFSVADVFTDARVLDGFETAKPGIRIVFANTKEFNNGNLSYWPTGIDLSQAAGLPRMNTVQLSEVTAANSSRVVVVKAKTGSTNLATTALATALTQTGAWEAVNDTTGSVIACSAVSAVTVGGVPAYSLTFSTTNYPSTSGTFTIRLKAQSALSALTTPIEGYETPEGYTLQQTAV